MLSYNTPDFKPQNNRDLVDFYKALLRPYQIDVRGVTVSPYSQQGDFITQAAASTVIQFFDIGNPSFGNISNAGISSYPQRSFYHGHLLLNSYKTAVGTGSETHVHWITSGPPQNVTNFLYKSETIGAGATVDALINVNGGNNYIDSFDDVLFSFLRQQVTSSVGTVSVTTEYLFQGLRIDY